MRVLRPPRSEAIVECCRDRQTGPLNMREHKRLHAVLFRSNRKLVKRRDSRQRRREPLRDCRRSRRPRT
jgi:hypothetical protein